MVSKVVFDLAAGIRHPIYLPKLFRSNLLVICRIREVLLNLRKFINSHPCVVFVYSKHEKLHIVNFIFYNLLDCRTLKWNKRPIMTPILGHPPLCVSCHWSYYSLIPRSCHTLGIVSPSFLIISQLWCLKQTWHNHYGQTCLRSQPCNASRAMGDL